MMHPASPVILALGVDDVLDASESAARLLGRSREALVGTALRELCWSEADAAVAAWPAEEPRMWSVVHADGHRVDLEVVPTRLSHAPGEPLLLVERRSMPAELQERMMLSDRMAAVGTLAAGVAHEINNPLAMVLANLDLLADEVAAMSLGDRRSRLGDRIASAVAATERVQRIVADLRTFSRYDTGEVHPVEVAELLATTARLMEKELRNRAQLETALEAGPPVRANPAQLGQVFLNLLQNAAQAVPEGAPSRHRIRISCRSTPDDQVEIVIIDDGEGMDEEVRRRAFEPFFTTRPIGTGTGLGLSYCHNVVSGLGGRMLLDSAPDRGTTVRLLLPVLSGDPTLGQSRGRTTTGTSDMRLRVLVIDDEPEIGHIIAALLHDHVVHASVGGQHAVEQLARPWDVVLCDLMMPEVSGMELYARALRDHPDIAATFVFLTGGATSAEVEEFLDTCGRPVLTKPFRAAQLREVIEETVMARYT